MSKATSLAAFLSQSEEDLEELAEELERQEGIAKAKLLADAKEGKFDVVTTRLLGDLDKAKEKLSDTKHVDAIITRAKAMEFHDGVEPLAMTALSDSILIGNAVPDHLIHVERAILRGDYDES
jgi:hypothetical protein